MRKQVLWGLLAVCVAAFVGVGQADASSIGPDCPTCQGSIYTLNILALSTSGLNDEYLIGLTIDTTGYNGGGLYINSVALKVSDSIVGTPVLLDAPPGGVAPPLWIVQTGGLNAGGCNGAGSGFFCAVDGNTAPVPSASLYSWVFDLLIPHNTLLMTGSIKVQYVDASGTKVGTLVSENIAVPDGDAGTFALLGLGLLSVGAVLLLERFFKGPRLSSC